MGKTYSCAVEGCDKVFSRDYELRKHKVTHEDPDKLFYCKWTECDFYTLNARNLDVHAAIHTGKKIHHCPHTSEVLGPSGSPNRCNYSTNDRSLLTKHRHKKHGYKPHPRAPSKSTGTIEFVFENIPSSHTSTSSTPPHASNQKRAREPKAAVQRAKSTRTRAADEVKDPSHAEDTVPDYSSPSTSQQGAEEYERANVELSDTIVPNPVGFTNTASVRPNGDMVSDAHAWQVRADLLDRTSPNNNTFAASNSSATHGQSAYVGSSYATAYSTRAGSTSTTPVAPNQGYDLFDRSRFSYMEQSTSPYASRTYNPAAYNASPYRTMPYYRTPYNPSPDLGMKTSAIGNFGMYFGGDDLPGFEAWDGSHWDRLWEGYYNSHAR